MPTFVNARGLNKAIRLLFPPDPGALRLLAAFRATLAGTLSFFLVMLLGTWLNLGVAERILGFVVALFVAANVRDGTPRQRLTAIAVAPFVAFASTALAAALLDQPFAAAAVVPLIMFAIAYASTRGSRYGALGVVSMIAYFISLVTREPLDTLAERLLVLLLAAASAALVLFVLLPVKPQAELERLRQAIHTDIVRVLEHIKTAVAAGIWTGPQRTALHDDVRCLSDAIMLAQARIAALAALLPGQGNRWLHLLAIELAAERTVRVALADLGPSADRPQLLATLTALQQGTELPARRSGSALAAVLALLAHVMRQVPSAAPLPATAPPPAIVVGLRPAFQTAIAAGLAIAGGQLVSPNRWYWAAFAAFVMFQGTRSRGETVAKGVQFIIGTFAGVLAGMLAATLLSGHELLTMAGILIAVFLAFQANVAAYGVMVFWITIILGLLFGMLGYFPPDLLLLRLQEAAVGAASGTLVASLVLVRRDHTATREATAAFLWALGETVRAAVPTLTGDTPPPDLSARVLAGEQRFRELSDIARSEQSSLLGSRNEALRRRMLLLEACEQWSRELGQLGLQAVRVEEPEMAQSMRDTAAHIETELAALTGGAGDAAAAGSVKEDVDDASQALEDDAAHHAVRLLLRIDSALTHLAAARQG